MNALISTNCDKFLRIKWRSKHSLQIRTFLKIFIRLRKKRYDNLVVPIAFKKNRFFVIDFKQHVAVLFGGTTGFGKTNLIANMLFFSMVLFEKETYEVYIMEKKGDLVIFENYFKYVGDVTLKMFRKLEKELKSRIKLFKGLKVSKIDEYNRVAESNFRKKKKYIFIYIDEYLMCDESIKILNTIISQGRAYGFRLIVTAHTMHNDFINNKVRSQFEMRFSFHCNSNSVLRVNVGEDVAKDYLKEDKLYHLGKGKLIAVDAYGLKVLQVPFIQRDLLKKAINLF